MTKIEEIEEKITQLQNVRDSGKASGSWVIITNEIDGLIKERYYLIHGERIEPRKTTLKSRFTRR